jgi:glycogen debranching enzyme
MEPYTPETIEWLRGEARRILDGNRQTGVSAWEGKPYDFCCPANLSYPFQWFWDSCFHAIVLTHLDPARAKSELATLLSAAQPDGFIPHIVFWQRDPERMKHHTLHLRHPYFTSTIQPPVIAYALERVVRATGDQDFLRAQLPRAVAFFRWLREHRDPDGDHLISIIQPDESGVDASPKYDSLMNLRVLNNTGLVEWINAHYDRYIAEGLRPDDRPLRGAGPFPAELPSARIDDHAMIDAAYFSDEDVLVNTIYAEGLACLARLCDEPEAGEFAAEANAVRGALVTKCWDPERGLFWDLAGPEERPLRVNTISSLLPLLLPDLDRDIVRRLVEGHLLNPHEYGLPFPVPSVAADEPSFAPDEPRGFIWRGPSWLNTNWFLVRGLRMHGYQEAADHIAARTVELVRRSGFRECYNPLTGAGQQSRDFGWSTLVLDIVAGETQSTDERR